MGSSPGSLRLVLVRLLSMRPVHRLCELLVEVKGWVATHWTRTQCLGLDLLVSQSGRIPVMIELVLQITSFAPG